MAAKQFILALDQGTTSSRAMIVDASGAVRAIAQHPFRQIFPQPGWVEHSPTEIWSSQSGVATAALAKADLTDRDIAAIGITNQRETTIVWDRETGEPVYNAIVWQDRRTAEFCDHLRTQRRRDHPAEDRPHPRRLLLRQQGQLDPCQRRRRARPRRGRQACLRYRRQLAHLEAHQWHAACHRRHQRIAHHALQHSHHGLGRRAARPARRSPLHAARGRRLQRRLRHHQRTHSWRTRRWNRRRPAGSAVRTDVHLARHGEVHLRHRRVHAAQHRNHTRRLEESAPHHRRLEDRQYRGICP